MPLHWSNVILSAHKQQSLPKNIYAIKFHSHLPKPFNIFSQTIYRSTQQDSVRMKWKSQTHLEEWKAIPRHLKEWQIIYSFLHTRNNTLYIAASLPRWLMELKRSKWKAKNTIRECFLTCSCCCKWVISAILSSLDLFVLSISCLWVDSRHLISWSFPSNWFFLSFFREKKKRKKGKYLSFLPEWFVKQLRT